MTDRRIDPFTTAFIAEIERRSDINSRFSNLKYIGAGAFSVVFSGFDHEINRRTAVKFLNPLLLLTYREIYRIECFTREAELTRSLSGQPDIIGRATEMYELQIPADAGFAPIPLTIPFYAMELAQSSFQDTIVDGGWTSLRLLQSFRAMCRAIQRIHSLGIVHRDLKPENFLVFPKRTVKLADFGTARLVDATALQKDYGFWPGDSRYTAPELYALLHSHNPAISARSDVFSLGAVLFELFTGTKLGLLIYDPNVMNDLAMAMSIQDAENRADYFHRLLPSIVQSRELPLLSDYGATLEPEIAGRIERLYRSMVQLDYRTRQCQFKQIFSELERCTYLLTSRVAFERLEAFRAARVANRAAKGNFHA